MGMIDNLIQQSNTIKLDWQYKGVPLIGVEAAFKVFSPDGSSAFLTKNSKLDSDTDGIKDPDVDWTRDSTEEPTTSIDPTNSFFSPNKICGSVTPQGNPIEIRTVGTAFRDGNHVHFVVHDFGPHSKFGEGTPMLLRMLGADPVRHGVYHDVGLDNGVDQLFYIGVKMPAGAFTQDDVNALAEPLFQRFLDAANSKS